MTLIQRRINVASTLIRRCVPAGNEPDKGQPGPSDIITYNCDILAVIEQLTHSINALQMLQSNKPHDVIQFNHPYNSDDFCISAPHIYFFFHKGQAIAPSQLAIFVNLHRVVIGPSAILTGRWRPDIDLHRMLTGLYFVAYYMYTQGLQHPPPPPHTHIRTHKHIMYVYPVLPKRFLIDVMLLLPTYLIPGKHRASFWSKKSFRWLCLGKQTIFALLMINSQHTCIV